jgi:hypothetical protein
MHKAQELFYHFFNDSISTYSAQIGGKGVHELALVVYSLIPPRARQTRTVQQDLLNRPG